MGVVYLPSNLSDSARRGLFSLLATFRHNEITAADGDRWSARIMMTILGSSALFMLNFIHHTHSEIGGGLLLGAFAALAVRVAFAGLVAELIPPSPWGQCKSAGVVFTLENACCPSTPKRGVSPLFGLKLWTVVACLEDHRNVPGPFRSSGSRAAYQRFHVILRAKHGFH